jgi:YggT family protein
MGGSYLGQAGDFLISTLTNLYATAVLLRFLLQWARADFYNPISQALVRVTNPALRPLRRFIPGWNGLDMAALTLMLLVLAGGALLEFLLHGVWPGPLGLVVLAVARLMQLTITVFIFTLVLQGILSLLGPGANSPATGLIWRLTRPLLEPVQPYVPPLGGLDFSPLVVIIGLQLLQILLVAPLLDMAARLL